jgi:membrane associated rhomboid family serine protease
MGIAGLLLATLRAGHTPLEEPDRKKLYASVVEFSVIALLSGFAMNIYGAIFHSSTSVDNAGHLGGMIFGALVGAVVGKHLTNSPEDKAYRRRSWWALGFFVLVLFFLILMWRLGLRVVITP